MTSEEEWRRKIRNGEVRREHGLETDSGSMYYRLTVIDGMSDEDAQYEVYKSRGIIKIDETDISPEEREEYVKYGVCPECGHTLYRNGEGVILHANSVDCIEPPKEGYPLSEEQRDEIWDDAMFKLREAYEELEKIPVPKNMEETTMKPSYEIMMRTIDLFLVLYYG